MIKVEDRRTLLSWRESGSGDPVLFIHAFPLSSAMWEAQLASIPDGWRGIAPDLPGFGSTAPVGRAASMDGYADDLAGLLDRMGIDQAVVCGLSMGGYIAFAMLRRHPDRVRALVLCDTRAEADTMTARMTRIELAQKTRHEGMQPVIDGMLSRLISRVTRIMRPALLSRIEEMMRSTRPESAAHALTAMAHRPDSTAMLRDIDIPTLVIVGAEDEITPPGESQMLARGIRGARIEIIGDAGHLSNLEQPEMFNTALRGFLAALPRHSSLPA